MTETAMDTSTGGTPPPNLAQLQQLLAQGQANGNNWTQLAQSNRNLWNQVQVLNAFQQNFGRPPTEQELNSYAPMYGNTDANDGQVNALIAQAGLQAQNTPENIAAQQQQQWTNNAPQYADQVNQAFQSLLGRAPTQAELTHFGSLMASGNVDQYGVQTLLQGTQEYQDAQTQKEQSTLAGQLQGSNADYYNKYLLPGIQQTFANQGRTYDSSGFQNSAIQAGQQQNYALQQYLAQFAAGQYGQSNANVQANYTNYLNQNLGLQNSNTSYQLAQNALPQQQAYGNYNYNLQQQAYNNYLNQYGKRSSGIGGLLGGLGGAAIGYFGGGGAAGAQAGYSIGAGLGNYGQSVAGGSAPF